MVTASLSQEVVIKSFERESTFDRKAQCNLHSDVNTRSSLYMKHVHETRNKHTVAIAASMSRNNHQIWIKIWVTAFSGFWCFDSEITLCGFDGQSLLLNRFQVRSPGDEEDLVAGSSQAPAIISTDSS